MNIYLHYRDTEFRKTFFDNMQMPITVDWAKVDQPDIVWQHFASRRSQVYGTKGIVSSSQPLATAAGLEILSKGGNAGEPRLTFFYRVARSSLIKY